MVRKREKFGERKSLHNANSHILLLNDLLIHFYSGGSIHMLNYLYTIHYYLESIKDVTY